MGLSERDGLKDRIEAKRKRLAAARATGREEARGAVEQLEERVGELDELPADGWDRLGEGAAAKPNAWLSGGDDED